MQAVIIKNLFASSNEHTQMKQMLLSSVMFILLVPLLAAQEIESKPLNDIAKQNLIMTSASHSSFSAAIVFDASGSMVGQNIDQSKIAGHAFINKMGTLDETAIVSFSNLVTLHQSFTSDTFLLHVAVDSTRPTGGTTIWDALYFTASLFQSVQHSNRYIIVISDGADGSSTRSIAEVISKANAAGAHIITIALGPNVSTTELQFVAAQTSGKFYAVPDPNALPDLFISLIESFTTSVEVQNVSKDISVSVFPQPSTTQCTITTTLSAPSSLELCMYDRFGRVVIRSVSQGKNMTHTMKLDVANLLSGVYYLSFRYSGHSFSRKIQVVR